MSTPLRHGPHGRRGRAATTMAQNWWLQSVESFDKRNMHKLSGATDSGFAVWSTAFHEEGTIEPGQRRCRTRVSTRRCRASRPASSGLAESATAASVSARCSATATPARIRTPMSRSAKGHVTAYGLNANYKFDMGLYFDASWHAMSMDTDLKTPGTASSATGEIRRDGDGFNLEAGYAYGLKSGLTLVPQLQYSSVDVELDDFSSSDGVYRLTDVGGTASMLRPASRCSRRSRRKTASSRRSPTSITCTRRRRQRTELERRPLRQRHLGFWLSRGVRHRRPLQGLGHQRTGRRDGHLGVRLHALHATSPSATAGKQATCRQGRQARPLPGNFRRHRPRRRGCRETR